MSNFLKKSTEGKGFGEIIKIIFAYWVGKIFGWFYLFYLLAIIGGIISGEDIGFLSNLFLFLTFALLPFVAFAFFSIIIKKIIPGRDDLGLEFKILLCTLIFFACFIFFAIFNPNTILGLIFLSIIKEFFIIIIIGLIILYFGITTLVKFFKLKPKNKKIITYFINDLSIWRKILISLSFLIIIYIFLTIINIVTNWDEIVDILNYNG